jgi:hypothetical protein
MGVSPDHGFMAQTEEQASLNDEDYAGWEDKLIQKVAERVRDDFRKDVANWFLRNLLHATWRMALVIGLWEIGKTKGLEWAKLILG